MQLVFEALMSSFFKYGITDELLKQCFIGMATDGASVMTGARYGLAAQLKQEYPLLFIIHCQAYLPN